MEDIESVKKELSKIPWCAQLLDDPKTTAFVSPSRRLKKDTTDRAFSTVLNTRDTIAAYVALYQKPDQPDTLITELKAIITIGSDLNGFHGVCHGGIIATLLDETSGELINVNLKHHAIKRTSYMTGYLNTSYRKPVTTPGTWLLRARLTKYDGKKVFITTTVEDGQGAIHTQCEALFIGLRQPIGRL